MTRFLGQHIGSKNDNYPYKFGPNEPRELYVCLK